MDMLALPTAPVAPTSAKRLFLLLSDPLEEVLSKEWEGERDHVGKGREPFEKSPLTGDESPEELAEEGS